MKEIDFALEYEEYRPQKSVTRNGYGHRLDRLADRIRGFHVALVQLIKDLKEV